MPTACISIDVTEEERAMIVSALRVHSAQRARVARGVAQDTRDRHPELFQYGDQRKLADRIEAT